MATPFPYVAGAILTADQLNNIQNLPINDVTANYVLVNNDRYKRVIMNAAGSTTITVNNSIFVAGDVIQISNKGAGSTVITAGAGVTINTAGSLTVAQYGGGYILALSASTFTFFNLSASGYGTATGGTSSSITVGGVSYTMLEFLTDANLVVSKAGLFDVFAVGGGGGAGAGNVNSTNGNGGGAGGGSVLQTTIYLPAATYAVDIGAGGAAVTGIRGNTGFVTSIGTVYYVDGGAGGGWGPGSNGVNAGGGSNNNQLAGVTTAPNIGFSGGLGAADGPTGGAGGGAGASAAGSAGGATGGAGGAGVSPSTFSGGTKTTTVGGGGGGGRGSGSGGTATDGGGAGTSSLNGAGTAGTTNRGGGGGGANGNGAAGAGSSGLCYIRFKV